MTTTRSTGSNIVCHGQLACPCSGWIVPQVDVIGTSHGQTSCPWHTWVLVLLLVTWLTATTVTGQEKSAPASPLSGDQAALSREYQQVEELMLKLANVTAKNDPVRAQLLRQAFARSKEKRVHEQLADIARMLGEQPAYDDALRGQKGVAVDIKAILDVLQSEDRAKKLESESKRLRRYLEWIGKLIRQEEAVHGRTEGGDDPRQLADRQREIAEETARLRDDADKHAASEQPVDKSLPDKTPPGKTPPSKSPEGKPPEPGDASPGKPQPGPSPPSQPGGSPSPKDAPPDAKDDSAADPLPKRLRVAEEQMREAQQELEKAQTEKALDRQRAAVEQLKQAQAELEKILRQMREEQIERVLTMLEARYRKMLELQTQVLEATQRLDKTPLPQRDRDHAIEAGRQSVVEREIGNLGERALVLLREDGSAAAMLEAATQVQSDVARIAELLSQSRVDKFTQTLEQDVLSSLKEIIDALAQAKQDQQRRQQQPPPGGASGEPPEQALVDGLQELRMIRTLQWRINRRTQQYGALIAGEQANDPQVVQALRELATQQKRLVEITRDVTTGKTE